MRAPHAAALVRRRPSGRGAGFSLIELMVALTVGGIAIGAMYAIGSSSSRTFQVQHQVANMQSALRFAYLRVKRDLMRAGYQSSPNALPGIDLCGQAPLTTGINASGVGWIAGISSYLNNVTPNIVDPLNGTNPMPEHGPGGAPGFSRDEVTLIGNYASSNEYPGVQVLAPTRIALNIVPATTWHSLQSDFGWAPGSGVATPVINPTEVANVFRNGDLVRIQTTTGQRHFATLNGNAVVDATTITLNLNQPIPSGTCLTDAEGGWVAPLRVVRYGVQLSAAGSMDTDRITGNAFAQLGRTELQPLTMQPAGAFQPILDYVATFNLSFIMNDAIGGLGLPDTYQIGVTVDENQPGAAAAQDAVNNNPERVRSVVLELGVRAPDVDPGMRWPCPPQTCMALWPDPVAGSQVARVRVLRSEIFLPNIALGGL